MSRKINLYSDEWVDLLFKDRHREYGAFQLRKDSPNNHKWGIIVSLFALSLIVSVPILYKQIKPKAKERVTEVTVLSNIEIEQKKLEEPKEIIVERPAAPPLKSTIKFTPPVIKPDDQVLEEEEIKTQEELKISDLTISIKDVEGTDEEHGVDIADVDNYDDMVGEGDGAAPFLMVEQMPEFPGGEQALRKFLAQSVRYPVVAQENGVQGKVFINFVVERDGSISNVVVVRGVDSSLDKEVLRVVAGMPKWLPGKQNGKAVRVSFTVPISFVLQ